MSKFKVGDKVVCVETRGRGSDFVRKHSNYTVEDTSCGGCVGLEGISGVWYELLFELAEPKVATVFEEGFDANGNVFNITEADLEPMMRAETRGEGFYILVEHKDVLIVATSSGFDDLDLLFNRYHLRPPRHPSFDIVALYGPPELPGEILNQNKCGPLIWKRKEALSPKEKALAELKASMQELQGKIDTLEKEI